MKRSLILIFLLLIKLTIGRAQNTIPAVNQEIINYVTSVIGKKVDRGECWDLANRALTLVHASWDGKYKYGKLLNPKKDSIYPGDLIQFEGVQLSYTVGKSKVEEDMPHHTAIVYKVIAPEVYQIADQNNGVTGKKVGLSNFDLKNVKKGKMKFYRPVPKT